VDESGDVGWDKSAVCEARVIATCSSANAVAAFAKLFAAAMDEGAAAAAEDAFIAVAAPAVVRRGGIMIDTAANFKFCFASD